VTHFSAADSIRRPGGEAAPCSWVLLKRKEGVRGVLAARSNRARARLTGGCFGGDLAVQAERSRVRGSSRR
jgi:hypothetical protein